MANFQPTNPLHNPPRVPVTHHGVAHQTPAVRHMHTLAHSGTRAAPTGARRRKKKAVTASPRRRKARVSAARSGRARLVKGSAAARKHMAQLRAMRKGKRPGHLHAGRRAPGRRHRPGRDRR